MSIKAKVILDSYYNGGTRLTTFEVTYPRFILPELLTHRALSRNTASSRAIPTKKFLDRVLNAPAVPIHWGQLQPGMQASAELSGWRRWAAEKLWMISRYASLATAYLMLKLGVHKQVVNRLLEPWMYVTTIITATEWSNFYALRNHSDAQPEIKELAQRMLEAHNAAETKVLRRGEWHLPYILPAECEKYSIQDLIEASCARCARVSYLNHDGSSPNVAKDKELYRKLVQSTPIHGSALEHCAMVPETNTGWFNLSGNFVGWIQYRKTLKGENTNNYAGLKFYPKWRF